MLRGDSFALPLLFAKKSIGLKEFELTRTRLYIGMFLSLIAGFLSGLFASTGIWLTYLFLFAGLTMVQTAGTRKITGFFIGLSTSIMFIFTGLINWPIALAMGLASGFGGWVGAGLGIKAGNIWIKRAFAVMVIASAIKMIFY